MTDSTAETPLQKERRLFRELLARLVDTIIQHVFDLNPKRAKQRLQYLIFLFLLSGFIITLTQEKYSLVFWGQHLQSIFLYLFNPSYAATYDGNPISDFINFAYEAYTNPHTLQYLPIFLAPFFIALQSAAMYLKDIFELEDVSVARSFIREVALSGSNKVIRIKQGDIADEHRHSSSYLIGGPGKVIVDLDTVALFERPDGTPHIVGPTGKSQGGKATLEGFERFRQAIDLRDHFIELRDQDKTSQSVASRSLDGIPISAMDVNFLFSIHRNDQTSNAIEPYPFNEKAIERLIYQATSRVTPESPNPSSHNFDWKNNMVGMIRGKLSGFMSERKLTEYLASIGQPEYEKAKAREEVIAEEAKQILPPNEKGPEIRDVKRPPEFTPRYKITSLFTQFAKDFIESARAKGVQLHWISVGTWKTPIENVFDKHFDAWKISRENLEYGRNEVLEKIQSEAELNKTISLIQNLPLYAYEQSTAQFPDDRDDAVKALLLEYHRYLKDQMDLMQKIGLPVNPTLVAAIFYIDKMMAHKLYPPPPKPKTPEEERLYIYLLAQTGSPEAIEKLEFMKRETHPEVSREAILRMIVDDWNRDIGMDK
jgi:hypothetical protein